MTRVWVSVAALVAGLSFAQAPAPGGQPPQRQRTIKEIRDEGSEIVQTLQGQLKDIEAKYNEAKNTNNATKIICLEEPRTTMRGVVRTAEDLQLELDKIVVVADAEEKVVAIRTARDQGKKAKEAVEACEVKSGSGGDENSTLQVQEPNDLNTSPNQNQSGSTTTPTANPIPASPT